MALMASPVDSHSFVLTAKPRGRRSRGCTTCRQRKVKCDEKTPFCLRCQNSNRECLGYESPQVFINQVLAAAPASEPGLRSQNRARRTVQACSTKATTSFSTSGFPFDFAWRLPPESRYSPLSALFASLNGRSTAYVSGLCLAEAFYARANRRQDLMEHATALYSRSLQRLRQDLKMLGRGTSAASIYSNLWSSFLLCLYEIISGGSAAGWLEHCHGVAALVVNCLIRRKRCFLETLDWKTVPWSVKQKSLGSRLQNIFCDIPGMMEEADEILSQSAQGQEMGPLVGLLRERVLILMQQACELRWQWEADNSNACKEVPWTESGSSSTKGQAPSPFRTVFHFWTIDRAIDIAYFDTVYLLLDTVLDPLMPESELFSDLREVPVQTHVGPFPSPLLLPWQGNREDYALEICRIVDFMSHCEHANLGMFMLMFPLYMARVCLVRHPGVCAWITNMLESLVPEKGFHIGQYLAGRRSQGGERDKGMAY
ncbi:hypothetical protein BBK36DRAFT_1172769 [Trichoderma citrinoviride]|uniref:Zn(2)-C6 fungal-type domain-containing protein n=1 Tax=Trichoderma citrinoviride TaxID=58853 RepID=A0A2T4AYR3_9HYPO|nr:hypothetical protein BBK36DRAFT_1172769 [Trichoderma citrinoviride]PTB62213.1 hypothetical protein BBK36DRAFT_1172769 [Trichoderma citrinoviride]